MQHSVSGSTTVLVPGITAPSSVTCVRSLGARGISTLVGSEVSTTPATASRYCDEFVQLPDPTVSLTAYGDALLELASRPSVRTVLPVREEDVYALSVARDDFSEVVATPWPDFDTLQRVQDRVELFDAADRAGVSTPRTRLLDEWDDWSEETIVKPRYTLAAPEYVGERAANRDIGSTVYQEPGTGPDVDAFRERWGHVPLVQEYIDDPREFGFFALYDEGEAVATFQHCQYRGYKYCGGPSAYRESISDPALERAGLALLDELEWHGLAMVEFLRDPETGTYKLMEVNPRLWSSLPFTVRAGVDFPYYTWQLASGAPVDFDGQYDVGIGGHLLRGELCYLHSVLFESYPMVDRPSVPGAFWDVASSLVREPRFDYARAHDPRPFVRDLLNSARTTVGGKSLPTVKRSAEPAP